MGCPYNLSATASIRKACRLFALPVTVKTPANSLFFTFYNINFRYASNNGPGQKFSTHKARSPQIYSDAAGLDGSTFLYKR